LQRYFEQVGKLLIKQPLRRASPSDNLSTVVRAQTLTVLVGLDPDRKRILLQFLYDSGLIKRDKPVVDLSYADLTEANLSRIRLDDASLRFANVSDANLKGASLNRANLYWSDLTEANLGEADLNFANLSQTYLDGVNLTMARLHGCNFKGAKDITKDKIEKEAFTLGRATMPDGSTHD